MTNEHAEETFELQRDANEKLVLALLRESTRADHAAADSVASQRRERELIDTAEFRERLIGIVGHDLRNPLNAVLMATSLLLSSGHLPPVETELATRALDSSRRMKHIIVQVLEFTRAHLGGGFELDRARTDLGDVAHRIAAELRMVVACSIDVEEVGDVSGLWDAELLGEVLSNLAGNAVQHAAPGTRVTVLLVERGERVFASITNHGETIPRALRDRLFDPFRRTEGKTQRAAGNLGLGLYIASEIVRAHAGRIDVVSEDGVTTFTVVLPRELPH
jgi:signal transduction histidine kinase